MAYLTANRPTDQDGGVVASVLPNRYYFGVAASTHIYQGALVALNSSGYLVPAGGTSAPTVVGRADFEANNSTGAANAIGCEVRQGAFLWNVSGTLTIASIGQKVYAKDDNTVVLSNSGNTGCAGLFMGYPDANNPLLANVLTVGAGAFGAIT